LLKVLVVPADAYGCGYYRLIWVAEYLKSQGYDIEIQMPSQSKDSGLEIKLADNEVVDVTVPGGADVLVLQRVSHYWHSQVITLLRTKGVAVVIDMDDDLSSIHRDNIAWMNYHPRSNTPYSWKHVEQACKDATLVTVSTKPLLDVYARHGRGQVLDNYVPAWYLDIKPEGTGYFGWAGTTRSHPDDLPACGKAVQNLIGEGYQFKVIGPKSKVKEGLRLAEEPEYTGVVDLDNWAREIAKLSVALAPLTPSKFNQSKSRLKIVEAMAVGVPWVGSPRPEYMRVHRESGGVGILVDTPKDWYRAVKKLMDDGPLRQELGESGKEYMRDQTIEANAWRWLETWARAYDIEKGKVKA
jgi:glycosyltransferase involved in cell wall biosynthesis